MSGPGLLPPPPVPEADAVVARGTALSHRELGEAIAEWCERLCADGPPPRSVVALAGDFSPAALALLFALWSHGCCVVPIAAASAAEGERRREIAEVEHAAAVGEDGTVRWERTGRRARHPLLALLGDRGGLVLFSSASTGPPKAILHDTRRLLRRFDGGGRPRRTLAFLLFDHIGGLNTVLHALWSAGTVVVPDDRSPDAVCAAIAAHRVELLPATPTFLNLLLVSGALDRHDVRTLRLVTYGTEPMPEPTLRRFHARLSGVRLLQTYGMSEVGIFKTRSRAPDSLWVGLGGEGFETRVVDGLLEVRSPSTMLGVLNAPADVTPDGWVRTHDVVDVDGPWLRFRGRDSEVIVTGGEKVFPTEVEGVIESVPGVVAARVRAEANALIGQAVVADVVPAAPGAAAGLVAAIRAECRARLARHKVPQRIRLVDGGLMGERAKKTRSG